MKKPREYIEIGPSPAEESCAQVGEDGYIVNALSECRRFIDLIRRKLGPEPEGASLEVKKFPHDFGYYVEVVCYFDESKPASVDYAFRVEANAPAKWEG